MILISERQQCSDYQQIDPFHMTAEMDLYNAVRAFFFSTDLPKAQKKKLQEENVREWRKFNKLLLDMKAEDY
jgi:hypothetical protein